MMCSLAVTKLTTNKATVFGLRILYIPTDSMSPEIKKNSFVIAVPVKPEDVKEGDIITYIKTYKRKDDTTPHDNKNKPERSTNKEENKTKDNTINSIEDTSNKDDKESTTPDTRISPLDKINVRCVHRVIKIEKDAQNTVKYTFKGDNLKNEDPPVYEDQIEFRILFHN